MSTKTADSGKKASANNLSRQIGLYSLAAAAAGVSLLAIAQPAAGEVVVTRKTIPIPIICCGGVGIDMNHDGVTDFTFIGSYASFSGTSFRVQNSGVAGTFYASALARGAEIGPSAQFNSGSFARIERATGGYLHHKFHGNWGDNAKDRYLGVHFLIDGETHYGWIRLTVAISANPARYLKATITGYAYETEPNKAIFAGQTEEPTAEVKSPENVRDQSGPSLGMLAAGAETMPLWRRQTNSSSQNIPIL